MLRQRSGLFLLLTALFCLCCHEGFAATIGRYTPCIIPPTFQKPDISRGLINRPDINPPKFVHELKSGSLVETPEIIRPVFVHTTIVQPVFDGCHGLGYGYMETVGAFGEGITIPFGVSPCCGGSVASPALDNKVARPWTAAPNN